MKRKNFWTHTECQRLINEYKDKTAYFDDSLSHGEMYWLLHKKMGFGEAETIVILAALIKCGAHFK